MNFLELCQEVARESGTISGTSPSTVVGQSGRLLNVVSWTQSAWARIQKRRVEWDWRQADFSSVTIAGTQRYTGAAFGLTRFSSWVKELIGTNTMRIYKTSDGVASQVPLQFVRWPAFYTGYLIGTQPSGAPMFWSISPAGEMVLYPVPDDVYTVSGIYRKDVQVLEANTDTPEMPEDFHDLIVAVAITELCEFDEAPLQYSTWTMRKKELYQSLEQQCLPEMIIGARPIA